jgi:ABC-type uncharacterized transport system involved in gliding motility auxiliary subunit
MKFNMLTDKIKDLARKFRDLDEAKQRNWLLVFNIVIIILINLVSLKLYFRLDLTGNSAYSLSETSREVISSLESPLTLRVFFSEDLPAPYNNVQRYLGDLLEEYAEHAGRNFQYRFINPAHEKNKKEIEDYGVRPVKVSEYKRDKMSVREAYMAVAIEHEDLLERMDSITSVEGLEYQITSLIKKMTGKVDALHRLKDPISVTLFATKNVPDLGVVMAKVKDRVNKCSVKNYNKLRFEEPVDPYSGPEAMARADEYGVQKILLRDQKGKTEEIRLGLVVEHKGRFETVHLLSRNMFSLYSIIDSLDDIINGIVGSMIGINPVIGYVSGHNEHSYTDQREGAMNFRPLIPDMYDFKNIDLKSDEIPDSIKVIVINGPKSEFSDEELFKIDQYLMKGNSVILFLDAFREDRMRQRNPFSQAPPMVPNVTGVEKLAAHYGVSLGQEIVLDTRCLYYRGESLHLIPQIDADGLSRDNEITRYLKQVFFVKSSPVIADDAKLAKNGAKKTILVSSSPGSWTTKDLMPWSMFPPEEKKRSKFNLAVLLDGRFESYFKGVDTSKFASAEGVEAPGKKEGAAMAGKIAKVSALQQSLRPGKILLLGSSEITKFDYQAQRGSADRPNAAFVQNVLDYMNGNYGIPEMRSKGLEINPIRDDNVLAMLLKKLFNMPMADAVDWAKIIFKLLNILVFPALIVSLTGAAMMGWRRKRKARLAAEFSGKEGSAK